MKRCPDCTLVKGYQDFNRNRSSFDGYAAYCRECYKVRKRESYYTFKRRDAARSRKNRYGIRSGEFVKLVQAQAGKCAICREDLPGGKHRHLDHCHETGKVRGVLCGSCNKGLGHFKDNPDYLRAAMKYVVSKVPELTEDQLKLIDIPRGQPGGVG